MRSKCVPALVLAVFTLAAPSFAGPKVAADAPAGTDIALDAIAASVEKSLDRTADPCADFYRFACGGWLDQVELPADEALWARSFSVIDERNRELLKTLIEDAGKSPAGDADRRLVGTYYAACMDESAVEKAGMAPIAPWLARIDSAKDRNALFALAGELQTVNAAPYFDVQVFADLKDPNTEVAHLSQGGLGLPERDYYLSDAADKKELRAKYSAHVAKMLALAGASEADAAKSAAAILEFETALATASRPVEKMRIYDELHHRLDAPGLAKLTPTLPWTAFFAGTGRTDLQEINVMTPEYFEALAKTTAATDIATLRAYFKYQLLSATAGMLPDRVYQEHFDFAGRTLGGQAEPQPRWKRCIHATEQAMGEPVGKLYVAERFPGRSKEVAVAMIGDITGAFEASLPRLAWMDETTRKAAVVKKGTLRMKIGYPDKWRDYSKLEVKPGAYFENGVAARKFETAWQVAKVGKPVDKNEFPMDPHEVNASYNPLQNAFTYPAGILQPPFFHKDFPDAMNLGGIGFVIGHELTHGFDDQGRKFNEKGEMTDWWTAGSVKAFEERAACIDKQYAAYEIEPGMHLNGKLTLGENIGDNGGLKQAWDALQTKQTARGEGPKVAGLTEDQLFFVAAAQVWCTEASKEIERLIVQTNPHSPSKFRVVGPMVNHPGFAPTFSCAAGTPMNPAEKCEVW
jgi:putative endopeptidase